MKFMQAACFGWITAGCDDAIAALKILRHKSQPNSTVCASNEYIVHELFSLLIPSVKCPDNLTDLCIRRERLTAGVMPLRGTGGWDETTPLCRNQLQAKKSA